jgi:rhamnosyltransferase
LAKEIDIDILLSTYNPDPTFLLLQLESIKKQTLYNSKYRINPFLIIRDDNSKNFNTIRAILVQFDFSDYKIIEGEINVGFFESYNHLLRESAAKYVFLCDQDDIWHENKLIEYVQVAEKADNNIPLVVYSNLKCIDANGKLLSTSYTTSIGYHSAKPNTVFFLQNYIPGCALMLNDKTRLIYNSIEKAITYHDHLIILVAYFYGSTIPIKKTLGNYRFHTNNTLYRREKNVQKLKWAINDILKYCFSHRNYWLEKYQNQINQIEFFCSDNYSTKMAIKRKESIDYLAKQFLQNVKRNWLPNWHHYIIPRNRLENMTLRLINQLK